LRLVVERPAQLGEDKPDESHVYNAKNHRESVHRGYNKPAPTPFQPCQRQNCVSFWLDDVVRSHEQNNAPDGDKDGPADLTIDGLPYCDRQPDQKWAKLKRGLSVAEIVAGFAEPGNRVEGMTNVSL